MGLDGFTIVPNGYGSFMETMVPLIERDAPNQALEKLDLACAVVTSAELAECTCPEWCERDHDRD